MTRKQHPRGIISVVREDGFWGIYIPKFDELLPVGRLGDVKVALFRHFDVATMAKPDVEFKETAEYTQKVRGLRKVLTDYSRASDSEVEEITKVVRQFKEEGVVDKKTAAFLGTTQKKLREIRGEKS